MTPTDAIELADQVVVVTGAGDGIGAEIARQLGAAGATVVVTDIDRERAEIVAKEVSTAGGAAHAARLDVTDRAAIGAVLDETVVRYGRLTTLVANAGVSSMHRFEDIPPAEWDRNLAVNTTAVFASGQEAVRRLVRPGGAIVNIASMAAKQGRVPYLAHYVASKFAVVGLTQAMAYELGPVGIRVNSVCPGFVATAMQERELRWEAELAGSTPDQVRDGWVADTPLGRLEEPADVARAVVFLCSPAASFITGEALAVNGGAFMD